ncbi:hypothetical protein [Arachnia propionica]|uniref:hypothetical protein n=1 Tax=Arachnia propionica TaxID=1750 RepID=UPI0013520E06|nr:hypothetical protein [Arachnia propionica]
MRQVPAEALLQELAVAQLLEVRLRPVRQWALAPRLELSLASSLPRKSVPMLPRELPGSRLFV